MDYAVAASTSFKDHGKKLGTTALSNVSFFGHVRSMLKRDYVIIMDKSGSMSGSLWEQAKRAVSKLAPFVCKADPDGITLYFFSSPTSRHPKYEHVRDARVVENLFSRESCGGTTDLAGVLRQALDDHFNKGHHPETILVITDGAPDNKQAVKEVIKDATWKITCDEELSISFVQIGSDPEAHRFLKELDSHLSGAKYDIVDEITTDQMNHMSFEEIIEQSIND